MAKKWDTAQVCIICEQTLPCGCSSISKRSSALNHAASPVEAIRAAAAALKPERQTKIIQDAPTESQPRQTPAGGAWHAPRTALDAMRAASVARPATPERSDRPAPASAPATATDHPTALGSIPSGPLSQVSKLSIDGLDSTTVTALEILRPLIGKSGGIVEPDGSIARLPGREG